MIFVCKECGQSRVAKEVIHMNTTYTCCVLAALQVLHPAGPEDSRREILRQREEKNRMS
jgi:hypothetical protein